MAPCPDGHTCRTPRRACIRGDAPAFTVIEFMVVIAIVVIASALLLPALSMARKVALQTVCQNNLKQIGIGVLVYRYDYGCFPAENYGDYWFDALPMVEHKFNPKSKGKGYAKGHYKDRSYGAGASRQFEMLKCPCVANWDVGRDIPYGYNYKYLGSARECDASPKAPFENFPVGYIANPRHTVAFGDSDGTGWTLAYGHDENVNRLGNHGYTLDPTFVPTWSKHAKGQDGAGGEFSCSEYRTYISDRHRGGANFCCVDGHVTKLYPEQVYADNSWWNGLGKEDPANDPHVDYVTGKGEFRYGKGKGKGGGK